MPVTPHELCQNGERFRVPWDGAVLGWGEGCRRRWVCTEEAALRWRPWPAHGGMGGRECEFQGREQRGEVRRKGMA